MPTITAKEYAALIEVSAATVTKKLKSNPGKKLPGTVKHEKIGNQWMITIGAIFHVEKNKAKFKKFIW